MVSVEVRDTEHGPEIVLIGLSGEEIDSFSVAKWFDHNHEDIENIFDHKCEECEQSHCDDGNCSQINMSKLNDKIDEIKHAFHEMERIIDA